MGMQKESKKAKKKSKKEVVDEVEDLADAPDFDVDGSNNNNDSSDAEEAEEQKKKTSKKKKSKSSKKRPFEEQEEDGDDAAATKSSSSKPDRATRKAIKKEQKEALMAKIPKLDPEGIPYNKIQIRRMLRRVKHGLDPIATEEEEKEIRERERREKAEEEQLLFAERNDEADQDDEDGDKDVGADDSNNVEQEDEEEEEEEEEEAPSKETAGDAQQKKSHNPPSKKTKRSKPVPPDYTCQACQNSLPNFTPHWIYDCPNKVTQRGCNSVAKKLRGLHDPPSRKVFVSGLPFECTEGHVKRYFEQHMDGTDATESIELVHCKLLKFEDSTRCKGQAFLTFESDLGAKLALKLNGSVWEDVEEPGVVAKKKKIGAKESTEENKVKELKLKVTKVLNRHVTKKKFGK
ncbi:hypothetical protein ACHAXM_011397 [Skeletonema potamos]|jgi:hypothetical protein